MSEQTPFARLYKIGTYLDEDLPNLNKNVEIIDAQLQQAHEERRQEENTRQQADEKLLLDLQQEGQARQQADSALAEDVQEESRLRTAGDTELADSLKKVAKSASDALSSAMAEHDAASDVHAALIKRITMGDLSPVIGVALVETGSGSGLWCNVDAEGRIITPPRRYFDFHPVYSALEDRVLVDGQVMQRHTKFYYKTGVLASGELKGKHARFISPEKLDGYKPFPSFMRNGAETAAWYCGTYSATDDGGNPKKLGSRPGRVPFVNVNFPTMQQYCQNRNAGGVSGFDMWDIWQVGEIQLLFLMEYACPDSQGIIGRGRVDTTGANYVDADDVARATWRGHVGLWGNVWEMVAGIDVTTAGRVRLWNVNGSKAWIDTGFVLPAYDGTNMAYPKTLKTGQGNGWDFDALFLPETATLSLVEATMPDGFWGRSGGAGNVLYLGGAWDRGSGAGLFCQYLNNPASTAGTNIGCRLAKA